MTTRSEPLKATVWMIGAMVSFSLMAVSGRELATSLNTFEIMLYRSIIGFLIVLVIGVMIVKEIIKRKNVKELALTDPLNSNDPDSLKDYSDLETLEKDSAYSEHSDSRIPDNEPIESSQETKKDSEKKIGENKD